MKTREEAAREYCHKEAPKPIISLEFYIKMQMEYLTFFGSSFPTERDLIHAKSVADKILEFNNVKVKE